jgi:hypothetical protein
MTIIVDKGVIWSMEGWQARLIGWLILWVSKKQLGKL